jgi:catalase
MAKSTKPSSLKAAAIHDQKLGRGEGGELHQIAEDGYPVLTTAQGGPVADDLNSLKIGARGPTALEDFHFREKIFHFDHERIPERVVHARGYGAHGYFETYKSLSKYTRADIFQRAGEKTPAFVRFSTVAGNKGSADLARSVMVPGHVSPCGTITFSFRFLCSRSIHSGCGERKPATKSTQTLVRYPVAKC